MKVLGSVASWVWCVSLVVGAAACDGDTGGASPFVVDDVATLEIYDTVGAALVSGDRVEVAPTGGSVLETFRLENTGSAPLVIHELSITSDPPGSFSLLSREGAPLSLPLEVAAGDSVGARSLYVDLHYVGAAPTGTAPSATITIRSNAVLEGVAAGHVELRVVLAATRPVLVVTPDQLDFGRVGLGERAQKSVQLLNQGSAPLVVDRFVLSGHPGFSLAAGGAVWPVSAETSSAGVTLDAPLTVASGTAERLTLRFEPAGPEPANGTLILFSNDPSAPSGVVVPLQGNVGGPCIALNPKSIDFGGKLVGKRALVDVDITSCGDQPLEITQIALRDGSDPSFELALDGLPTTGAAGPPSALGPGDPPLVLQPNQTARFQVAYVPEAVSPLGDDGQPLTDHGAVVLRSNAFVSELDVDVKGFGVAVECPTAVIIVQEGEEVVPQTTLHLIGSQSYAATGQVVDYRWDVSQPVGSASVMLPSAGQADPTFEANVAGTYVFRLTVVDSAGVPSCKPAEATVFVNPEEAIHIELLWHTPNDPDETDEGPVAGADLDLHFTHPFATGGHDGDHDGKPDGWFDQPFDTFWFNPQPDWGSLDVAIDDNPGLDRDDTDGAGPENVNLDLPEHDRTYKIGVHYWNDHGFGPSYATVRVYVFSTLVFELAEVELVNHDMWCVATIDWPTGNVELCRTCAGTTQACTSDAECAGVGAGTCALNITPNYVHPYFAAP